MTDRGNQRDRAMGKYGWSDLSFPTTASLFETPYETPGTAPYAQKKRAVTSAISGGQLLALSRESNVLLTLCGWQSGL